MEGGQKRRRGDGGKRKSHMDQECSAYGKVHMKVYRGAFLTSGWCLEL